MRIGGFFFLALCLLGISSGSGLARVVPEKYTTHDPLRTLYVSPFGDDAADGLAPERAFRTISAAARAVQPGDLVLVSGGVYQEYVNLKIPGTADHPIVFRAAPGETALISAMKKPRGWRRVEGRRFAYSAPFEEVPDFVMDERNSARYFEAPNLEILDESPGSYMYQSATGELTAHALQGLAPDMAGIFAITFNSENSDANPASHESGLYAKGVLLNAPYVRVEGFHVAFNPIGLQMMGDYTEAWDNKVYGNALTGIQAHRGAGLVVANNESYLNEGSGLLTRMTRDSLFSGNLLWGNTQKGAVLGAGVGGHEQQLAIYGNVENPTVAGNLVIGRGAPWSRGGRVFRYKTARGNVVTRRNILTGGTGEGSWGERALYENNTVVGGRFIIYSSGTEVTPENAAANNSVARGNLYLKGVAGSGFADPGRNDYRLHEGSVHLGEGAWPEAAPVRYVSPVGDDGASGDRPDAPWCTLARAVSELKAGDTLYVMPGEYKESVAARLAGEADKPIEILTYSKGRVVVGGGEAEYGFRLEDSRHVRIDGFIFSGTGGAGVEALGGGAIELANNVFDGLETAVLAEGAAALSVENCTFRECGAGLRGVGIAERVAMRNNLFQSGENAGENVLAELDEASCAVLVSERNAFAGPGAGARLAEWRGAVREAHPSLVADVEVGAPDYLLPTPSRWSFAGLGHKPLGARGERDDSSPVEVESFEARFVSTDRAVVEWYTPYDYADARLTWQARGGETRRETLGQYGTYNAMRKARVSHLLTGLEPETKYELRLEVSMPGGRRGAAELAFRTASSSREPTTLYVAPDGRDENSGISPDKPFKTINAAMYASSAGDTIEVAPGVYAEPVRVINGGLDKERPITLRSAVPGAAIMDLGGLYPTAFDIRDIENVTLDGFRIRGMVYSGTRAAVYINNAENIVIGNFLYEGRFGGGSGTSALPVSAIRVRGLHVRNCLFQYGFINLDLHHVTDAVIDHNTFYKGGVTAIQHYDDKFDARFRITNNIFYDVVVPAKINAAVSFYRPTRNLVLENNVYWREKAQKMGVFGFVYTRANENVGWADRAGSVDEVRERYGIGRGDIEADPLFEDAARGDFRLKAGSPAIGLAEDGSNAGMLTPPARM